MMNFYVIDLKKYYKFLKTVSKTKMCITLYVIIMLKMLINITF